MFAVPSTRASCKRIALILLLLPLTAAAAAIEPTEDHEAAFAHWVHTPKMKRLGQYANRLDRLGLASKDSIPLFVSRIGANDVKVRRAAALALRLVGREDPDATVPALTQAAQDSDPRVRGTAVAGLGEIGLRAAPAVAVILEVLENDKPNSYIAARALAKIGMKTEPAVDALAKALNHTNKLTRASAANALGNIGPEARNAVPALRAAARDNDSEVRLDAAYALWKIENASDAIEVLIPLLDSDDPRVGLRTIEALGEIGPPAKAALPALERVRKGDNKLNGVASAWAMCRVRATNNLVEKLLPGLQHEDPMVRIGAAWALGKMGPEARVAIPAMRELLDNASEYGYSILYVSFALSQIEPEETRVANSH